MVICLERGADLHMAKLMPLPLTVSCFSKIQIGFTFLVSAHLGSPGHRAVKRVCVCVLLRVSAWAFVYQAEWVWCLNQTIARALIDEKKSTQSVVGAVVLLPPPRDRHTAFTFRKPGALKDAQYQGMWRCGKIHGQ